MNEYSSEGLSKVDIHTISFGDKVLSSGEGKYIPLIAEVIDIDKERGIVEIKIEKAERSNVIGIIRKANVDSLYLLEKSKKEIYQFIKGEVKICLQ